MALWWLRAGHIPTWQAAKQRLEALRPQGETPYAFTFRHTFAPASDRPQLTRIGVLLTLFQRRIWPLVTCPLLELPRPEPPHLFTARE
jgi:hypothetical protein